MPLSDPLPDPLPSVLLTLLPTFNHRHVMSSPSTNSELIAAIQDGKLCANEWHLLTAETQTAGRGQRGRSWQSPRGNVYLSLYHPVQLPISGSLSLIIGVELAKMPVIQNLNSQLQAQGLSPIGVKWANDLGFYKKDTQTDKGAIVYFNKLAGILIEPVWRLGKLVGVVMGVGLNVQATPQLTPQTCEGMSYQALSLQDIAQLIDRKNKSNSDKNTAQDTNNCLAMPSLTMPSLTVIYEQISHALIAAMTCFEQLSAEKSTAQTYYSDSFMSQFNALDALAGLRLRITQNHQGEPQVMHGHACGIDTNGCLQLRQDNGKLAALFTGRIDVLNVSDTP